MRVPVSIDLRTAFGAAARTTVVVLALAALLLTGLIGCSVSAPALDANHPANPAAPPGKLAGAPPSLRAGVVSYPDVPVTRPKPAEHHHHHAP